MAINIGANFSYNGRNYLDNRQSFDTLEAMKNFTSVPDGFITYCKEDGKRYEFKSSNTINELTGKWAEFKVSQESDCYYLGEEEPENDKIWFYTSTADASSITYDNPLIAELFSVIQSMQAQITQLQADVEYLKLNGGGGMPVEPPDSPEEGIEICFALEDGGLMLLEDGGFLILEETIQVTKDSVLILEDGSSFLLEDGSLILLEETVSAVKDNLMLLESGAEMLLENGYNILIEK